MMPDPGRPLVVVTYNVHGCIGLDRRHDPGRVAAIIRELDADIVALQEVLTCGRRGAPIDQLAYLAKETGLEPVAGPCLTDWRRTQGNAVLTRWPVAAVRRLDLRVPGREPRGALDIDILVAGKAVRVIATHLGLRLEERRQQVARLLAALAPNGASEERCPGLVLGDLNEWRRRRGSLMPVAAALGSAPAPATFPSWRPMLPLDRIFAAGSTASFDVKVHRSRLATLASDHLPLRALLAWGQNPRVGLRHALDPRAISG